MSDDNYWQSVICRSSQEAKRVNLLMTQNGFTEITEKYIAVGMESPMYRIRGYGPITKFERDKKP